MFYSRGSGKNHERPSVISMVKKLCLKVRRLFLSISNNKLRKEGLKDEEKNDSLLWYVGVRLVSHL